MLVVNEKPPNDNVVSLGRSTCLSTIIILDKHNASTHKNESNPVVNVVRLGRSNQSNINHHT